VIGLTTTLMGCQALSQKTPLPTKPTLRAVSQPNGDVCFTKQDASSLGTYILELERR
jgi:hypothetical protein